MPSIEFSVSLLATFFSPLLSARWLEVISATIFSFIILKTLPLKSNVTRATFPISLLLGAVAFYLVPQPPRPAALSAQPLPAASSSSGIYTAPGAVTRDTALLNSKITGCHTGIENYGVQENVLMENSTIECGPGVPTPLAPPPATAGTAPDAKSLSQNSSGFYVAPGVTTLNRAIINSSIRGCGNGIRVEANQNNSLWDDVHIECGQNFEASSNPTGQFSNRDGTNKPAAADNPH